MAIPRYRKPAKRLEGLEGKKRRIDPVQPRAQAVAEALRDLVMEQHLVPGDKLPSELELVEILGVGRSSIREGIQLLASTGIVEVEHGKGTFLAHNASGGIQEVIHWAYPAEAKVQLLYDLLEARVIVESAQARLAAERITDKEIPELLTRFGSQSVSPNSSTLTWQKAQVRGIDFHRYIARLAHNDVLLIMFNAVWPLFSSLLEEVDPTREEIARAHGDHIRITDAISRRDPREAESAMREHLMDSRTRVQRWVRNGAFRARS